MDTFPLGAGQTLAVLKNIKNILDTYTRAVAATAGRLVGWRGGRVAGGYRTAGRAAVPPGLGWRGLRLAASQPASRRPGLRPRSVGGGVFEFLHLRFTFYCFGALGVFFDLLGVFFVRTTWGFFCPTWVFF